MGHLIEASFIPDLRSAGNLERMLAFEADAGDTIFINSSPKRSELFFEALCGLRRPDAGTVLINGVDLYALTPDQGAAFRRENIGAIPQGLGWIPELRMIDQIVFQCAWRALRIRKFYGGKGTDLGASAAVRPLQYARKMLCQEAGPWGDSGAVICKPKVLVFHGFLDDLPDLDTDTLWRTLRKLRPEGSVLIYLSGAPAPKQVQWTRELRV